LTGQNVLEEDDLVRYLLSKRLINTQSIVDGDLILRNTSRRNFNVNIIRKSGPSYAIKAGRELSGTLRVAHEAKIYRLLLSNSRDFGLHRYLPHFHEYDEPAGLLILEYIHGAEDLRLYHSRRGRFPTTIACEIGNMLGALHLQQLSQQEISNADSLFPVGAAWTLSVHRPKPNIFHEISNANLRTIEILQRFEELGELLDQLRREWKAGTLIHFDIKWDNFLVSTNSAKKRSRLTILDWELAEFGDPCWDTGSVFSDYLSFWLLSIPITGESPPDQFIELARYPLTRMQPAILAFWQAYVKAMAFDTASADECLLRSVKYGAARLLQSAYEQMQTSVQLTGNVICVLQVSLNILQHPEEAIVHLLGIPLK
jgi:hypothetical protein